MSGLPLSVGWTLETVNKNLIGRNAPPHVTARYMRELPAAHVARMFKAIAWPEQVRSIEGFLKTQEKRHQINPREPDTPLGTIEEHLSMFCTSWNLDERAKTALREVAVTMDVIKWLGEGNAKLEKAASQGEDLSKTVIGFVQETYNTDGRNVFTSGFNPLLTDTSSTTQPPLAKSSMMSTRSTSANHGTLNTHAMSNSFTTTGPMKHFAQNSGNHIRPSSFNDASNPLTHSSSHGSSGLRNGNVGGDRYNSNNNHTRGDQRRSTGGGNTGSGGHNTNSTRGVQPSNTPAAAATVTRSPTRFHFSSLDSIHTFMDQKVRSLRLSKTMENRLREEESIGAITNALESIDWNTRATGVEAEDIIVAALAKFRDSHTGERYTLHQAFEHIKEFVQGWSMPPNVMEAMQGQLPLRIHLLEFLAHANNKLTELDDTTNGMLVLIQEKKREDGGKGGSAHRPVNRSLSRGRREDRHHSRNRSPPHHQRGNSPKRARRGQSSPRASARASPVISSANLTPILSQQQHQHQQHEGGRGAPVAPQTVPMYKATMPPQRLYTPAGMSNSTTLPASSHGPATMTHSTFPTHSASAMSSAIPKSRAEGSVPPSGGQDGGGSSRHGGGGGGGRAQSRGNDKRGRGGDRDSRSRTRTQSYSSMGELWTGIDRFCKRHRLSQQAEDVLFRELPAVGARDFITGTSWQGTNVGDYLLAHRREFQGAKIQTGLLEIKQNIEEFTTSWELDEKATRCLKDDLPLGADVLQFLSEANDKLSERTPASGKTVPGEYSRIVVSRIREAQEKFAAKGSLARSSRRQSHDSPPRAKRARRSPDGRDMRGKDGPAEAPKSEADILRQLEQLKANLDKVQRKKHVGQRKT